MVKPGPNPVEKVSSPGIPGRNSSSTAPVERPATPGRPCSKGVTSGRSAAADDDEMVGGGRHLAHQVAGDDHRPALRGKGLEPLATPVDALGVGAVGRLIADEDRWVAEQRERDPEAMFHPE